MNSTMIQYFHWYTEGNSQLFEEIENAAGFLEDLGIDYVWFPPAYKAAGGGYSVGYDPYDLFDLGEFDQKGTTPTKYGTKEQYLNAIKALKDKNIKTIVDIVLNHKAGGDETETFQAIKVNEENRKEAVSDVMDITSYTKYTFPGRGETYSNFEWNFTCFSGVDYAEGQEKAVYRVISDYGKWDEMIDDEKGNYDFLMYNDIEHRNLAVREELNHWGKWYQDLTDFDGVRLDAVKHISYDFYKEWLTLLRSNAGKEVFAVGEYWAPGQLPLLQKYIAATEGCMSLFDSSLQHKFHVASKEGGSYDLSKILADTLTSADPQHAVSLVDNHDTQPLQDLEAPVDPWFKPLAYALILLRKDGFPCVFYPDLFGAHYKDYDKEGNEQEIFLEKIDGIEGLLKSRKFFAYGEQVDYFDDAHCLGWTRLGTEEYKGCAVTMSNAAGGEKSMEMGSIYGGKTFFDYLGRFEDKITADENGRCNFPVPAGNVSVWVAEDV